MPSFLSPLLHQPAKHYILRNRRTDAILADTILTAFDSAGRNKGLLGRDRLNAGTAMILAPVTAIHTFFMKFPIDVLYADRAGRVLKVRSGLKPFRLSMCWGAFAVVEMAAGGAAVGQIERGDDLVLSAMKE